MPAEASAEFFAGVAPLTMKLVPGERLERGGERRIAHPVVRPGKPRAQGQHRIAVERRRMVEAGAELAARIGPGAGVVREAEASPRCTGFPTRTAVTV